MHDTRIDAGTPSRRQRPAHPPRPLPDPAARRPPLAGRSQRDLVLLSLMLRPDRPSEARP